MIKVVPQVLIYSKEKVLMAFYSLANDVDQLRVYLVSHGASHQFTDNHIATFKKLNENKYVGVNEYIEQIKPSRIIGPKKVWHGAI